MFANTYNGGDEDVEITKQLDFYEGETAGEVAVEGDIGTAFIVKRSYLTPKVAG